jgi:hypothetical protein
VSGVTEQTNQVVAPPEELPGFVLTYPRSCGGCTACCTGELSAVIHTIPMRPGRLCHFKQPNGCAIYDKRPELCRVFRCTWLENRALPEELWPANSNIIVHQRAAGGFVYYVATEIPPGVSSRHLAWVINWAVTSNLNLVYHINRTAHALGSPEFLAAYKVNFVEPESEKKNE